MAKARLDDFRELLKTHDITARARLGIRQTDGHKHQLVCWPNVGCAPFSVVTYRSREALVRRLKSYECVLREYITNL